VNEKSAADLSGPRRRCISIESATLSRCSFRHAANPWLTNKAGKQEAKEDDDERQVERHGPVGLLSSRGGRPDVYAVFDRVWEANARAGALSRGFGQPRHPERSEGSCSQVSRTGDKIPRYARDDRQVDEYVVVHNNTFMKRAALPVILLNTVRSTGATG
jgi:hypothetical protein